MNAADAIYAGFADNYIPERLWPQLIKTLEETADLSALEAAEQDAPNGTLKTAQKQINALFGDGDENTLAAVTANLRTDASDFAAQALKKLTRACPLSTACTIEMMQRLRQSELTLKKALEMEYRFTFRAAEHGDFLEGIRAAIIDKDRAPRWRWPDGDVPMEKVTEMLHPLGTQTLNLETPS
jgi:3-hydroxyisobutyrate dehydrogenase